MSCAWFTYFQRTSYCQLYKNCFRIDPSSCKECLSGEKDCSAPELKCWVTGQCKEDPFATNITTSSEECLEACQLESDCEWFTFDTKDSSCNLHKKCSSLIGCETCISGNTKCRVTSKGIYKFKLKHSTILYWKRKWKQIIQSFIDVIYVTESSSNGLLGGFEISCFLALSYFCVQFEIPNWKVGQEF